MSIHHTDDWLTVHVGDCATVLREIDASSVHCVVTSPPYWGLRDYGHDGQLGLEKTPEEYVEHMVEVFREVRRVLRDDGTLWLNLGDSYATSNPVGRRDNGEVIDGPQVGTVETQEGSFSLNVRRETGLKPKDLVGIPWRVAFALQADGWYLRSDIIWSKPNPMPESVTDRPTKAHEYVFLLSKSPRYYFDAEAVREPLSQQSIDRLDNGQPPSVFRNAAKRGTPGVYHTNEAQPSSSGAIASNPSGRNIRSVWTIATQPYPGAHFATFPEALVEPCVKAGTSERGACGECGAPWERVVERTVELTSGSGKSGRSPTGKNGTDYEQATSGSYDVRMGPAIRSETTGWKPTCGHDAAVTVPCVVLDPFGGSGTTAKVAQRLGRRAVLIELNPDYIGQAMTRNVEMPLGLEVSA